MMKRIRKRMKGHPEQPRERRRSMLSPDEDFEDEEEDLDELKSEARGFLKKVR